MLSSKNWMFLIAIAGLLMLPSNEVEAQSNTRYSNQSTQTSHNPMRTRSQSTQRLAQVEHVAPPAPRNRVAQAYTPRHLQTGIQTGVVQTNGQVIDSTPVRVQRASATMPARGARTAQMISETPVYDSGIAGQGVLVGGCTNCGSTSTHTYSGGCGNCGAGCSPGFGGPVETVVGGGYFDHGVVDDCCGGCGFDDCCDRGGCSACDIEDCWLNGLAGIFSTGEYFIGGTGFRSKQFQVPNDPNIYDDASFGFYGGFNFGMPLCKLTCGVVSGQVGVRAVSTEFDGNSFFDDNRDQTFFTAGFFRRVDYGLQFGVVADVLREEWFTETETVQIRGDLAWVYPSGSAFGFRFTSAAQDDVTDGIINGNRVIGLGTDIIDTYRFYYRHTVACGGYSDISLGWSNDDHFVFAMAYDMPLSETWAVQSSLTYLAGEDVPPAVAFAGNGNEVWNLNVGFAWRPRGRSWYRSYDRPLFDVADNGTMIITRN